MMNKTASVMLSALFVAGCNLDVIPGNDGSTPVVNIQVTETQDPDAFERIISELEEREIRTTVLVDADFAASNCERLRMLDAEGFELMAFVGPEAPDDKVVTMSMLSYEEQEKLIADVQTAIHDCLGKGITGLRPYRFDQNEDTYAIADSLGFEFNLGFVAQTERSFPGHENDTLPYQAPGYEFWAIPMHSVYFENHWMTFCDMPFSRVVDGVGWEALLKSELDDMHDQNRPLILEVHPYFSGVQEDWFEAFVNFLDYAKQQRTRFMTIAELVEWANQED